MTPNPFPLGWQVPAYRRLTLRAKAQRFAVCVFVLNEGERIRAQLRAMRPLADQIDIVIADGGSTDGGTDPEFLKEQDAHALLVKSGPGKLSAQMRMAFA